MDLFARLNGEGMTIVMVTHNPEIQRYFDRTIVLRDGRLDCELPACAMRHAALSLRSGPRARPQQDAGSAGHLQPRPGPICEAPPAEDCVGGRRNRQNPRITAPVKTPLWSKEGPCVVRVAPLRGTI